MGSPGMTVLFPARTPVVHRADSFSKMGLRRLVADVLGADS